MQFFLLAMSGVSFAIGLIIFSRAPSAIQEMIGASFLIMASVFMSGGVIAWVLQDILKRLPKSREERHRERAEHEEWQNRRRRDEERDEIARKREERDARERRAAEKAAEADRRSRMPDLPAPLPDPPPSTSPTKPLIKPRSTS